VAERGGFEPPVGFKPTHAFQACALNHSAISPAHIIYCEEAFEPTQYFSARNGGVFEAGYQNGCLKPQEFERRKNFRVPVVGTVTESCVPLVTVDCVTGAQVVTGARFVVNKS
jgi:hypothetical protein